MFIYQKSNSQGKHPSYVVIMFNFNFNWIRSYTNLLLHKFGLAQQICESFLCLDDSLFSFLFFNKKRTLILSSFHLEGE